MKNIIGACVLGLSMAFLSGCNETTKDVSGIYEHSKELFGNVTKSQIHLDKKDKGYNITVKSAKANSDVFDKEYDWGPAVLVDEFIIRKRDDEKVFQVMEDGGLKRFNFLDGTTSIYTKVD